jgi:hypothetical protein
MSLPCPTIWLNIGCPKKLLLLPIIEFIVRDLFNYTKKAANIAAFFIGH